jgi:hypothetical protein
MKARNKTIVAGLAAVLSLGVASAAWAQDAKIDDKAKVEHRHKAESGSHMKGGTQMHAQGSAQMKNDGKSGMKAEGGAKAEFKADESGSMKKREGSRMQMKSENRMDADKGPDNGHSKHMKGGHMKNGEARDTASGHQTASVHVTTHQRTEIRDVFRQHRVRPAEHITFEVNVGRRIPHTVHLYRLPPRIVEIVPAYEDYEYFELADGRIAIVDPDTWEIVAIMA